MDREVVLLSFLSHLPANPQCCSHSPCLLSLLLATALDFLNLYDHGPLLSRAFSPALATYCCIRVFVCFLSTLVMRFILILVLAHSVSCCSILFSEYMSILYCWKIRLSPMFCYYNTETMLLCLYMSLYVHVPDSKLRSGLCGS